MTKGVNPLVEVRSLTVAFQTAGRGWGIRSGTLRAVDGVTCEIHRSETLAVVGESGCGKTTLGRTMLALYPPSEGSVRFDGVDLASLSRSVLREWRRHAQMIFQ